MDDCNMFTNTLNCLKFPVLWVSSSMSVIYIYIYRGGESVIYLDRNEGLRLASKDPLHWSVVVSSCTWTTILSSSTSKLTSYSLSLNFHIFLAEAVIIEISRQQNSGCNRHTHKLKFSSKFGQFLYSALVIPMKVIKNKTSI